MNDTPQEQAEGAVADAPTLQLVRERKIAELIPALSAPDMKSGKDPRYEASGVLAREGVLYIVFDSDTAVARLSDDLETHPLNGRFGMAAETEGFEGIAFNERERTFYLLVESKEHKDGSLYSEVVEYSHVLSHVRTRALKYELSSENKGFEAIAYVEREGRDYILALCEGNKCKSGKEGRKRGGGRVHLFESGKRSWKHRKHCIKLPKAVQFQDYSGMAVDGCRVAVVSQEESMLWVGVFDEKSWEWRDDGRQYRFPRTADGEVHYGNIEGVAWLSESRIVVVSDQRKSEMKGKQGQPLRLAEKDQSVHIFDLPDVATQS